MIDRIIELVSLLKNLLETNKSNLVTMADKTMEKVLKFLKVTQTKVHSLQTQSQLFNDEIKDLKNQELVKCYELVLVQNNPLIDYDNNGDL